MPITQDRMIAVLEAASELLANYSELLRRTDRPSDKDPQVKFQLERLQRDGIHHQAVEEIVNFYDGTIDIIKQLAPRAEVAIAIAEERGHFNSRRARNDRTRALMRAARARKREQEDPQQIDNSIDFAAEPTEINPEEVIFHAAKLHSISYSDVANIIAHMGETNTTIQMEIINKLIEEGRFKTTHIGGQLFVADQPTNPDQGGLLPDRVIGLKKD